MVTLPGIYLDVKRNDTIHSLVHVNKVYLVLTTLATNWGILGGEELMQRSDKERQGASSMGEFPQTV